MGVKGAAATMKLLQSSWSCMPNSIDVWCNKWCTLVRRKLDFMRGKLSTKVVSIQPEPTSELSLISVVLQRDATLMLGYTSAMLVLERWDLAQMPPETHARRDEESSSSTSEVDVLTQSIINCALTVLESVGNMSSTFGTIPTYDILLGAYAGVTLVQLADSLPDIRGVSELMMRVDQQRRSPGCRDQVLTWASNMMQKKVLDLDNGDLGHPEQDVAQGDMVFQWMPLGVLDAVGSNYTST
jgi:hypothetical protein